MVDPADNRYQMSTPGVLGDSKLLRGSRVMLANKVDISVKYYILGCKILGIGFDKLVYPHHVCI